MFSRRAFLALTTALAGLALASTFAFAHRGGGHGGHGGGFAHFGHGGFNHGGFGHGGFGHFGHGGFGREAEHRAEERHAAEHRGDGRFGRLAAFPAGREALHEPVRPQGVGPGGIGRFRPNLGGPLRLARNGLPRRPFPGEPGFTGVPPHGETRFIPNEMIVHVRSPEQQQLLASSTRRLGVTVIGSQNLAFLGGMLFRLRIDDGRQLNDVIRAFEAERIGVAQPNYVFSLADDAARAGTRPQPVPAAGDSRDASDNQYVVGKLHLLDAHRLALGNDVLVAVIDSRIDVAHPDLRGSIPDADRIDLIRRRDQPDEHGTGIAGAIVAHDKLMGVAPHARILAIRAFGTNAQGSRQATTEDIVTGINRAVEKGARIINMSFAGPYDPALQVALKKAHDKDVILIAAAGNMGPDSPPLYPAADENVVAVTAVDDHDRLLPEAVRGPHIALAAPGVDVLEIAPHASYNFTSGTSIAAAHVSGVVALMLERAPEIDGATVEAILFSTAKHLGPPGRDRQFGYGLVDPYRALDKLTARTSAPGMAAVTAGRAAE